jgi:ApaG protein
MKNHIDVSAVSAYLAEQSSPEAGEFAFAYTITITNRGEQAAQLISRHWIITDGNDEIQEVKGEGVVGEQPILPPGASFEYTSGTLMQTPTGTMRGSYRMIAEDGTAFDADIPMFSLRATKTLH